MRRILLTALVFVAVACGSSGESDSDSGIDLDALLSDLGGNDVTDVNDDDSLDDADDAEDDTGDGDTADAGDDTEPDGQDDAGEDADAMDAEDTTDTDDAVEDVADAADADVADTMDGSGDAPDIDEDTLIDVPPLADVQIEIRAAGIDPFFAFAEPGELVRWRNGDAVARQYTSSDGTLDTGSIAPGATYERTFDSGGTWVYAEAGAREPAGHVVVRDASLTADHEVTVTIVDGRPTWTPRMLEIEPGDSVVWINSESARAHSVRSDDDLFWSGELGPGLRYVFTFDEPGDYTYRDEITSGNTGIVSVVGPPPETDHVVAITGAGYDPSALTVEVGQTILFRNDDDAAHSATALGGQFDSGRLEPGEFFVWTANAAAMIRITDSVSGSADYSARLTVVDPP